MENNRNQLFNTNEFEKAQIAFNNVQLLELNVNKVLEEFKEIIIKNENELLKMLEIEKKYNSIENINNIVLNINKIKNLKKEIEQRRREDKFIVSRYKENIGVLGIIFDGDIYVTIQLLKLLLYTKNAMVFCTNNKKYGIIKLLILFFKQALKICGYDEEIVQVINSENYLEMYNHDNILKKIIVIGNKNLQNSVICKSNLEVITSGYWCFDLYIENIINFDFIKKITEIEDIELNIYVNRQINSEQIERLKIEDYTEIENIDECIRDIQINSAGYSSSIFTKNSENANRFMKLVKSKNVFVNASPTAERTFDIDENDLLYIKQIMYKNWGESWKKYILKHLWN